MKKKKLILIIVVIAVLIVGGYVLKSRSSNGQNEPYQFTEIVRGDLENTVSSTGTLSAVETVEVGSQVSGIIEKLYVDYNSNVKQGQLLAVLDKTLFQVSVRDAEAMVFRAKAKLDQATAELNRNKPLFQKGHLSEQEYLVTETTARTAEADLKSAHASLNRAKTQLAYSEIRSPIDGTVIERTVDVGQTIAASFQAPKLFTIAEDLKQMQIEAAVDESDIGFIKVDQPVRFTVQAYPDETFTGKVRQVRLQPTTIQNVVNYTVVVDAANKSGRLLPGMTATVDFIIEQKEDVLLVSSSAVNIKPTEKVMQQLEAQMTKGQRLSMGGQMRRDGSKTSQLGRLLLLDEKGLPRMVRFKRGSTDGKMTQILDSAELKPGMQVIAGFSSSKNSGEKDSAFTMPRPPKGGGAMKRGF